MSFRRQLTWQTIANVGTALLGAVYILYVGRQLGVASFGVYAVAIAAATFSLSLVDLRLQEALVRYLAVFAGDNVKSSAFLRLSVLLDFAARLLSAGFVIAISPFLAQWLADDLSLATVFVAAACSALAAKVLNGVAVGILRAFGQIDWHAKILLVAWMAKLGLVYLVVQLRGPDVMAIVLAAGTVDGVFNLAMIARARAIARRENIAFVQGRLCELRAERADIAKFIAGGSAISASDSFVRELDTMIIALILTLPEVGMYRMAKYIAQLAWRAVDPVYVVLQPVFAKLLVEGKTHEASAIPTAVMTRSLIICAVGWGIAFWSLPSLAHWVLGEQYLGVSTLALTMLGGVVVGAPLIWAYAYWLAAGKPHVQLLANTVSALVSALCYLTLTQYFGLAGASLAFAVSLALPFILSSAFYFWTARPKGPRHE